MVKKEKKVGKAWLIDLFNLIMNFCTDIHGVCFQLTLVSPWLFV